MTCSTSYSNVSQGVAKVSRFTPLRHCATCDTPSVRRGVEVERRRGAPPWALEVALLGLVGITLAAELAVVWWLR